MTYESELSHLINEDKRIQEQYRIDLIKKDIAPEIYNILIENRHNRYNEELAEIMKKHNVQ